MKKLFGVLLFLHAALAFGGSVNCYNDDSQDVINQDALRYPPWGGPVVIPDPADCAQGPTVVIGGNRSDADRVFVDGKVVYEDRMDLPIEARVSPAGVVAILTSQGSLYVHRDGVTRAWFRAGATSVREFRMARDGAILAASNDGALIADGRARRTINTVVGLYASQSGEVVALLSNGNVVNHRRTLYEAHVDQAKAVKVAADGTVVWLTQEGKVGSTKNANLFDGWVDGAVSFKVNPTGRVAYLTREGVLGRDGSKLTNGFSRVVDYKINPNGAVTATDSDGRSLYFR